MAQVNKNQVSDEVFFFRLIIAISVALGIIALASVWFMTM